MTHKFKIRVIQEMCDVVFGAREEIVQAQHIMPLRDQAGAEMPAYETGAARDENASSLMHGMGLAPRFQPGKLKGVERRESGLKKTPNPTELTRRNHPSPWL